MTWIAAIADAVVDILRVSSTISIVGLQLHLTIPIPEGLWSHPRLE